MRNVLLVIEHEVLTMLRKPSFWFMTFLFPLLILGLNVGVQAVADRAVDREKARSAQEARQMIGYVDEAGVIRIVPPEMRSFLHAYPDREKAQAALKAGEIQRYYIVSADFMDSGRLILVDSQVSMVGSIGSAQFFEYLINLNLTGDPELARLLISPLSTVKQVALSPARPEVAETAAQMVAFATMFILFFTLTMSSSFMLRSVSREKENRTAEVLLVSLRPRELMLGKVVGLGIIALFQMVMWLGGGVLFMKRGRELIEGLSSVTLPSGFVVWGIAYFVLGYLLYASAMGVIGALAPTAREGGQFTFMVLLPLMLPLWMNTTLTQYPDDPLSVVLSLFPLTSPVSMITRMAATQVPIWQSAVGLLALAATAYGCVLLAARAFRADTLLSKHPLNWRRLRKELTRRHQDTGA